MRRRLIYCAFCGVDQHGVDIIVDGRHAAICAPCVKLCSDIIRGHLDEKDRDQSRRAVMEAEYGPFVEAAE